MTHVRTWDVSSSISREILWGLAQIGVVEVDVQVARGRREIGRGARGMRSAQVDHGRLCLLGRHLCQAQQPLQAPQPRQLPHSFMLCCHVSLRMSRSMRHITHCPAGLSLLTLRLFQNTRSSEQWNL